MSTTSNEAERQSLVQGLHDAVKQCQIRFGGRTELATENDSRVQCLLIQLERFFQHGIKRNKIREAINSMSEPFRQVTSKVLPILVEGEANFWPFVREHVSQLEVERYSALRGITTDAGRARAWLRSCLNEHSLEKYLIAFLQNEYLSRQYYEDWALMQDVEKATAITMLSRGLDPIYFAISIDNPSLNGPFRMSQQFADPSYLKAKPQENVPIVSGSGNVPSSTESVQKRRRKKAKEVPINEMQFCDEDEAQSLDDSKDRNPRTIDSNEPPDRVNSKALGPIDQPKREEETGADQMTERLSQLSTSFKSDFSTLSLDRQNSYPGCSIVTTSHKSNELTASEIFDSSFDCSSPSSQELLDKSDSDSAAAASFVGVLKAHALSPPGVFDMGGLSTSPSNAQRSRYSSAMLEEVLGSGELLSSSDGFTHAISNNVQLKTPPPTPATPDVSQTVSTVDPKRKLRSSLDQDAAAYVRVCLLKEIMDEHAEDTEHPTNGRDDTMDSSRTQSFDIGSGGDNISIASSCISITESLCNDLDTMKPLGTNDQLFGDNVMSYDKESSKAAVAALAVLNASHGTIQTSSPHSSVSDKDDALIYTQSTLADTMDNDGNLNLADLKQAILLTAKRKDEVEDRNRVLQAALGEQRERSAMLQSDLNACETTKQESDSKNNSKIAELLRENEVLKNQLKKYVAAVQMLRRDTQGQSSTEARDVLNSLRGFPEGSEPVLLSPRPAERSSSECDSIYEEKLGQMAELHGELLEFNEMLQKQLINRDAALSKLREELINLRGPLPADRSNEIEEDRRDSFSLSRPLINIWVPSVFMKGKGSDAYHLYQVYIRVGDEEWNIYRRYSQFYKLHLKAMKRYSSLEKFSFPPKKLIGKNDLSFVEKRRKRLQEYLRLLINACLVDNHQLSDNPNKENLAGLLPFFCDPYIEDASSKKKKGTQPQKSGKVDPRYTGL